MNNKNIEFKKENKLDYTKKVLMNIYKPIYISCQVSIII